MGCCGEDEEEILQPLHQQQTPTLHSSSSVASAAAGDDSYTTISPMNSNFPALVCKDILRTIFEKLPVVDLARSACVCRLWSSVASDREIQVRAFKAPWKLKDVIGKPSSGSFWRDNSLSRFAISHRLVRGDTVASLAVKYTVQVTDIKRLNNMMSDHGIHSRDRLLIPVSTPNILIDGSCYIELDAHSKREVAVLYLEGGPDRVVASVSKKVTSERGKRRVIDSLRRSMHVDDGTAQYYLSLSNGDPRGAIMEFSEDIRWERQVHLA
ncbi:F-box protein At1g55000 [Cynara cardunculus var. scolymus]|uniref:F-box domain, cyclin-like protein n=1 Tax=Cynara cardunculus var. scolymus TaxID=59895 RepID=A0A124SF04_CYNCS|nr:F-box protein At1g55000 [Cynara cardunculus var. scolymus]KVI01727.1 F-box domain, cyclin-like protein [Cynara cardunculus var. scolymus]